MVKQKQDFKIRKMLISISLLIFIVLLISVYLYQSFKIDLIMKDLHALHEKRKQLISETESLQAEVDRLSNIDRVSKVAREKFDLEFSDEQTLVVRIDENEKINEIKEQFARQDSKTHKMKSAGLQ